MKFQLTGPFNVMEEVRGMKPHTGIDLGMPEGTQLRSLFDGKVEAVWDHAGAIGNGVKIHAENGKHIIYGHMNKVDVHVGDKIHSGDLIGLSGNTGNSTGPHLHFGMTNNQGAFIDPTNYAEKVSNMSGDNPVIPNPWDIIGRATTPLGDHIVGTVKDKIREEAASKTISIIWGILDGLSDILVETVGAISLVGCTILMIMRIAGYDKGFKQAGMLFVLNILVKLTLGGK
jgi:hypothetical protein